MSVPIDPLTSEGRQRRTATHLSPGDELSPRQSSRKTFADSELLRSRVYSASDLSHYGGRDRFIIRAADLFFYLLIRGICSTLRWEVRGREHLDSIISSGHRPIFTFWHVSILGGTWFWRNRGIVVMSSVSRDAEYTGRVIKRFGYGTAKRFFYARRRPGARRDGSLPGQWNGSRIHDRWTARAGLHR